MGVLGFGMRVGNLIWKLDVGVGFGLRGEREGLELGLVVAVGVRGWGLGDGVCGLKIGFGGCARGLRLLLAAWVGVGIGF